MQPRSDVRVDFFYFFFPHRQNCSECDGAVKQRDYIGDTCIEINLQMNLHPPTRVQHKQLFLWINWTPVPDEALVDVLHAPTAGCEEKIGQKDK